MDCKSTESAFLRKLASELLANDWRSMVLATDMDTDEDDLFLLLEPARTGEFSRKIFDHERLIRIVTYFAACVSNEKRQALWTTYCASLLLHSYAGGYHWDAANQADFFVVLGCFVRSVALAARHTEALEFIEWLRRHNKVQAEPLFYDVGKILIQGAILQDACEYCLTEAMARYDPTLGGQGTSSLPILCLDFNGEPSVLEGVWRDAMAVGIGHKTLVQVLASMRGLWMVGE